MGEVLNLSDESNTLVVRRNLGDTVNMGSGWTRGANDVIGTDTFETFTQGAATLKVQARPNAFIELSTLNGTNGFRLNGINAGDQSGRAVSSAGDLNADGFDDFIIGAYLADPNGKESAGQAHVLFGKAGGFSSELDLASLNETTGFRLDGLDANDRFGFSVSSTGDVNGDGFADLLIGAIWAAPNGDELAGKSYVLFGKSGSFGTTVDLRLLDGTNGFRLDGIEAGDRSGASVSSAGDVNGDGFDDLIIGATARNTDGKSNNGESYVVFGKATGFGEALDLNTLDGTNGFRLHGVDSSDLFGVSVSSAGDVNGDGRDDLIIGSARAGETYVVFGMASGFTASMGIATLDASHGFRLVGTDPNAFLGHSVSNAGDVNGDGFDDLLIGAFSSDPSGRNDAGESYVVFGKSSGFGDALDLSTLNGTNGFRLRGIDTGDFSGLSVSNAGDVNGDGFDDLLIGTYGPGESYVIFGGDFTAAVTHAGTAASETLTGNASANVMIGGRGNDILVGNGGADVSRGGAGNDVLAISDLTFSRIVGGNGSDTLRLDGSGLSLNLTTLADNRLLGIENIDLTGSGNNILTLDLAEVLNLSDEFNTLLVRRDAGDTVNMGSGWTQGANETIGADAFEVFIQGQAMLKLQVASVVADFEVGTLDDEDDGQTTQNADLSLREAIRLANANANASTITFAPGLFGSDDQSIVLSLFDTGLNTTEFGATAFLVSTPITINGPTGDNGLTIERASSNSNKFRLFHVQAAGSLTLDSLTLSGGSAKGGDGNGGGGAAGMGGAVFNQGTLSIQNSTLSGHLALGGQGEGGSGGDGGGGVGANSSGGDGGGPNGGTPSTRYSVSTGFGGGGCAASAPHDDFPYGEAYGGNGGFGGGAGKGGFASLGGAGGNAGFGGGGGGFTGGGGFGGGNSDSGGGGGGGAGMGGAIFNESGTVTITNSTFGSNTAAGGTGSDNGQGLGGAVFTRNGTVTVLNSTLSGNTAAQGGGAIFAAGRRENGPGFNGGYVTLTLHNSILANTVGGASDFAAVEHFEGDNTFSGVGNLIESNAASGTHTGTFTGTIVTSTDPNLAALADNGGPTQTFALSTGSPTINVGNNAAASTLTTDQRGTGFGRVKNTTVDIGAFEFSGTTDTESPTLTVTPDGGVTNASPITFTFQFSEDVTGFDASDVSVTNGTAGTFSAVDGDTYTLLVTPTANGTVTASVTANVAQDAATNGSTAGSGSVTSDRTRSTLGISPSFAHSNSNTLTFTFQFSEVVTGFVRNDVVVTNGTAGTFTPVDGDTYTLTVTPTANGVVGISVANNAARDAAINGSRSAVASVISDRTAPTVVVGAPSLTKTQLGPITFPVTFADTNFDQSTLTASNVILNTTGTATGTISVDAGTGMTRTVTVSNLSGAGTVGISLKAGSARDKAGNVTAASTANATFQVVLGITVTRDAAGNLQISDTKTTGTNDALTVTADNGARVYVIHEPSAFVSSTVPGAIVVDDHTIKIAYPKVSGPSVVININSGDDSILVKGANAGAVLAKGFVINGGAGRDTITLDGSLRIRFTGTVFVDGGTEDDAINAAAIVGTGNFPVTLAGAAGNDSLTGGDGNDVLTGGLGNDQLFGNLGDDTVIEAGNVNFTLATVVPVDPNLANGSLTGLGTDALQSIELVKLTGGSAANRLDASAFSGRVSLDGAGANDTLIGSASSDTLIGGGGDDVLIGNAGNDSLDGNAGNDSLTGGLGRDKLKGGAGTDTLDGGAGHVDDIRFDLLDNVIMDALDILLQL